MCVGTVAALYDIHGNVDALRAVLAEPDVTAADRILLGGDIADGPFPEETLALLAELGDRVIAIRGNGERDVAEAINVADAGTERFVAERIGRAEGERLAKLPLTVTVTIDGLGPTLFCHATPGSDDAIITAITPDEVLAAAFAGRSERVMICGHVHVRFDRFVGDRRVINPGSVGMPYECAPGAYWALLGPDVELRRTPYGVADTARRITASGYPQDELPGWLTDPPRPDEVTRHFEALRTRTADQASRNPA